MKKKIIFIASFLLMMVCITGCDYLDEVDKTIKDSTKPNVSCTTEKQYLDDYGYSYYVEGKCTNNSSKDYDYLQIEYICYDNEGNNLGTAIDNTNNLLGGQTWKFKAMALITNNSKINHCEYHELTGW